MNNPPPRLPTLDALRGIASFSVCWFHLTNGNPEFLPRGFLKLSGQYGWLGVEMFFVISGFVIPYALQRGDYRIADYGTFILKRIIRLDPPYFAAILLAVFLGYLSSILPGFNGPAWSLSFVQLALHLGYVNVFFGYPWINPVFWTLAIELQYYLFVGLLFPIIVSRSLGIRILSFASMAVLAFAVTTEAFLFHWLFAFMLGMVAFQLRAGLHPTRHFLTWVVILGLGTVYANSVIIAVTVVATSLLLGLFDVSLKQPFLFLGNISYSLYLIHVPIGVRVINLSLRFVHTVVGKCAVLLVALAASTVAAWLLHRFVELPAQRWSSGISYMKKQTPATKSSGAVAWHR